MCQNGKFLVLEGLDGSGKSTQLQLLQQKLAQAGIACTVTCEPTDQPIGQLIRRALSGQMQLEPQAMALLFAADRVQHAHETILPSVASGVTVVSDRCYFSNFAYQSEQVPLMDLIRYNEPVMHKIRPDVHLYLQLSPEECMRRIQGRTQKDLFETLAQLERIHSAYLQAFDALQERENIVIIDADGEPGQVADAIWETVRPLFRG